MVSDSHRDLTVTSTTEHHLGLVLNVAVILRSWIAQHHIEGPLITLGVQSTPFSRREYFDAIYEEGPDGGAGLMTDRQLYQTWGMNDVITLDVSDYEGAD